MNKSKEIKIDLKELVEYVEIFACDRGKQEVFYYLNEFIENELEIKDFDVKDLISKYD